MLAVKKAEDPRLRAPLELGGSREANTKRMDPEANEEPDERAEAPPDHDLSVSSIDFARSRPGSFSSARSSICFALGASP